MSVAVAEVFEALKAIGVSDDKAMAAAKAVLPAEARADLATKADLAELKSSLVIWLVSTQLAQLVALVALLRLVRP